MRCVTEQGLARDATTHASAHDALAQLALVDPGPHSGLPVHRCNESRSATNKRATTHLSDVNVESVLLAHFVQSFPPYVLSCWYMETETAGTDTHVRDICLFACLDTLLDAPMPWPC